MFQFIYSTQTTRVKTFVYGTETFVNCIPTHLSKRTRNHKCSGAAREIIQSIIIFIQRDYMASKTKVIKFLIKRY